MRGYRVPSNLIDKIEREALHIGDFSYTDGMDKVIDAIKDLGEVELDNPWHTGTPTEIEEDEYWKWNYALVLNTEYDCIGNYLAGMLFAPDFERQVFTSPQGGGKELIVPFEDVVAWQKIEPYRG